MSEAVIRNAEVLIVGTEILRGIRFEKNLAVLARSLAGAGIVVNRAEIITDDARSIADRIRKRGPGLLVVSGGLGTTRDDRTRSALAAALSLPLVVNRDMRARLVSNLRRRGIRFSPRYHAFRLAPRGARCVPNPAGLADGILCVGSRPILALPGIPSELAAICESSLVPALRRVRSVSAPRRPDEIGVMGMRESEVEDCLVDTDAARDGRISILPTGGFVYLVAPDKITAREICRRLGPKIFTTTGERPEAVVIRRLRRRKQTLSVAESCTGGLLAARISGVPGASMAFRGGVVAYSNVVKSSFLGVSAKLIAGQGAVSAPVASAMASGIRKRMKSDWGIAITGVAGPSGGTRKKPVGTVFVAIAGSRGSEFRELKLAGDRRQIRRRSVDAALESILALLSRPLRERA